MIMTRNAPTALLLLLLTFSGSCLAQWDPAYLELDPTAAANHFEFESAPSPTLRVPEEMAGVSEGGTLIGELVFQGAGPALVDGCTASYDDGSSPDAEAVVSVDGSSTLLLARALDYQQVVTDADPKLERFTCSICLGASGSDCQDFQILYKDENDNSPYFVTDLPASVEVAENDNSSSFSPLDVVILDRDTGLSPAVLSLADPEDQAYFELQQTGSDPDAGSVTYTLLRTDQTFDFETQRSYQVDLLITDGSDDFGTTRNASFNLLVTVLDANDMPPVFIGAPYTTEVEETQQPDEVFLTLLARDQDQGENNAVTYSIQDDFPEFLQVDPSSGEVSFSRSVSLNSSDLNGVAIYDVVFVAADGGDDCQPDPQAIPDCSANATVALRIRDVNDHAPVIEVTNTDTVSIPENSPAVLDFGIVVSDGDSDVAFSTFAFTITNEDDLGDPFGGAFTITPDQGIGSQEIYIAPNPAVLESGGFFDYEVQVRQEMHLRLTATDQDALFLDSVVLTVILEDTNDYAPEATGPSDPVALREDLSDAGEPDGDGLVVVALVEAADGDFSDEFGNASLVFSLGSAPVRGLSVDEVTGEVKMDTANNGFDFEEGASYIIQVIVEDMEGNGDSFNVALSGETSVVFELSNVNDESPQIDPLTTQEYCLYESGLEVSWPAAAACDTELTSLVLTASDRDLDLADLNMTVDFSRTEGRKDKLLVDQSAYRGFLEAAFQVSGSGDSVTGTFVVDENVTIRLDREEVDELTVYIVVTDVNTESGTGEDEVIFHLVVVDLDDSAPEFVGALPSESSFGVQEADGDDANEGALLSPVIQVHDPDETQPSEFTFTLVKTDERVPDDLFTFSTVGNAAYLEVAGLIDREDAGIDELGGVLPYNLTVEDEEGNVSEEQQIEIAVLGRNDNSPSFESHDCDGVEVAEDVAVDTKVCTMVITDDDVEAEFNSLSFGNLTGQPFRIDVVEDLDGYIAGAIVVDQQLDYETAISHSLFVTVSDGQRTSSMTVIVAVTDVEDERTNMMPSSSTKSTASTPTTMSTSAPATATGTTTASTTSTDAPPGGDDAGHRITATNVALVVGCALLALRNAI